MENPPTSSITAWPEEEIALAIDLDAILGTGHGNLRCTDEGSCCIPTSTSYCLLGRWELESEVARVPNLYC